MPQGEHSSILSTFIKLPFGIKIIVLSIFEWQFYADFTVQKLWPMLKFLAKTQACSPKNYAPIFDNGSKNIIILTWALYFPGNVSDYTYSMLAAIIK